MREPKPEPESEAESRPYQTNVTMKNGMADAHTRSRENPGRCCPTIQCQMSNAGSYLLHLSDFLCSLFSLLASFTLYSLCSQFLITLWLTAVYIYPKIELHVVDADLAGHEESLHMFFSVCDLLPNTCMPPAMLHCFGFPLPDLSPEVHAATPSLLFK